MSLNQLPEKIGRYQILSRLGAGGMGIVYKALDPVLGRHVALKAGRKEVLSQQKPSDGNENDTVDKLLQEARVAAQFIHPNIAITYDAGVDGELFYMALEYIDGTGLDEYTTKGNLLPVSRVVECIFNICYALEHIHSMGYIHLDVKPSNVMLTRQGVVKLMDFGIANLFKDQPAREKKIIGSPLYMSPEQATPPNKTTPQSDIYSLGVVLYELLAGQCPLQGKTAYEVIYNITNKDPLPIRKIAPHISHDLEQVINTAMEKDPAHRFRSVKEFADALFPIIKGEDSTTLNKQDKEKLSDLKRLLFFKHFQYSDLKKIIAISSWSFHPANTPILEESSNDQNIYFIVRGKASIESAREVKEIKEGDCFGESSVFFNMPRSIKILAKSDCVVMAINANILNQSEDSLQVKFLKEFFKNKTVQLIKTNLKLIQTRLE